MRKIQLYLKLNTVIFLENTVAVGANTVVFWAYTVVLKTNKVIFRTYAEVFGGKYSCI